MGVKKWDTPLFGHFINSVGPQKTHSLPWELETLPVAVQCKIKGLSAARSIYISNQLAIVFDSGDFLPSTMLPNTSTKFFNMKFSLMAKDVSCSLWQLLSSSATLGWQLSGQVTVQQHKEQSSFPLLHTHLGKDQKAAQNSEAGESYPAFPVSASWWARDIGSKYQGTATSSFCICKTFQVTPLP